MNRSAMLLLLACAVTSCTDRHVVTPTAPSKPAPAAPDPDSFISGSVRDTAARPLAGARVEVLDGPLAGTSTTVDSTGEFSITGRFDDSTRFRATLDDHIPAIGTQSPRCEACKPHRWVNFFLDVPTPPVNVAGDYAVTFIAADTCGMLPTEFRTHTFSASLTPIPSRPDTQFSLVPIGPSFEGFQLAWAAVAGNDVSFGFSDPGITEEVAEHKYLSFYGSGLTRVESSGASTMSMAFGGSLSYCALSGDTRYNFSDCLAAGARTCTSTNHQLILTRR